MIRYWAAGDSSLLHPPFHLSSITAQSCIHTTGNQLFSLNQLFCIADLILWPLLHIYRTKNLRHVWVSISGHLDMSWNVIWLVHSINITQLIRLFKSIYQIILDWKKSILFYLSIIGATWYYKINYKLHLGQNKTQTGHVWLLENVQRKRLLLNDDLITQLMTWENNSQVNQQWMCSLLQS